MSELLTTESVAPELRLEYWIDMICKTYVQLECDAKANGRFDGEIQRCALPGLGLSLVRSGAQRVVRTPREISRSSDDFFIVSIQTKGHGVISQDGRDAVLSPGDFALYDSTRPYVLHFGGDFEEIVLKLRGEQLRSLMRDTGQVTATTVPGRDGAGHLMIEMVKTLWREADTLHPASAAAVANSVLNILLAGLQSLPACKTAELSSMAAYHVARIKQLIEDRLRDPGLSVATLAAELRMSMGHLHRLFKGEPLSPGQYIWNRRLEACRRDLIDPRLANASVGQIAFSWGFNDAAHFSRAFRECFGCSPREWRQSGVASDH